MNTTHSSLLLRLRTREDSDAWSRFVKLYTPLVHCWVSRLIADKNQVEDLVQDVFVVLLSKIPEFGMRPPDSFRAWLRTVTLNKCRDWIRKKDRKTEPALLEKIESAIADPNQLLTDLEYRQFLAQSALQLMRDAFSDTTWRACWEHVARGRSAQEVSQELGISENAVYLARGRVLKRLRIELEGLWD